MTCFFGKDRAKAKSNHGTTSVSVEAAEAQARLAEQRSAVAEAQKREAEAVAREAAAQAGKMEAEARAKDAEARADKLETGMHEAEARAKDAEAALKAAQTSVQAAEARSDELMLELRQKTARLTQLEQQLEQAKQSRTTVSDSPRQPTAKDVTATLSEVRKEDLWEELRSVSRALSESKQATAKATERAKASETRASILEAELAAVQLAGPAEEEGGIGLGHLPGSDEEDDLLEQSWREALAPQQDVSPDLSLNRCGYTRSLEEEELEHLRLALENHAETALRDSVEAASKLTDAHHRIRELEEDVARLQAEKLPHEVPMQSWADLHPGPSTERIRPMSLSHLRSSTGSLADARQMLKADEDGRLSARMRWDQVEDGRPGGLDKPSGLFTVQGLLKARSSASSGTWTEAIARELDRCTGGLGDATVRELKARGRFARMTDARSAFGAYVCDVFRRDPEAFFDVQEAIGEIVAMNAASG